MSRADREKSMMQPHPSWMHELSTLTLTEWVTLFRNS